MAKSNRPTYVARCTNPHCYSGRIRVWNSEGNHKGARCPECNGSAVVRKPIPGKSRVKLVATAEAYIPIGQPETTSFGGSYDHPSLRLRSAPSFEGDDGTIVLDLRYQRNGEPRGSDERSYFRPCDPRMDFGPVKSASYARQVDGPDIERSHQASTIARILGRLEKARDAVPHRECQLAHDVDALLSLGIEVAWSYHRPGQFRMPMSDAALVGTPGESSRYHAKLLAERKAAEAPLVSKALVRLDDCPQALAS